MPHGADNWRRNNELPAPPASTWNPTELDTDQWLAAAKAMGAQYALLTVMHQSGFMQWQTNLYPYGCRQSPWRNGKGDLVGEFVESCRKTGIQPGLFVGTRYNTYLGIAQYKAREDRPNAMPTEQYLRLCEKIMEELCTRYGRLLEIWMEGSVPTVAQGGPDLLPIVDRSQPGVVFYHSDERRQHRFTPEKGVTVDPTWCTISDMTVKGGAGAPNGHIWSPQMALAPLREHDWFYSPGREDRIHPLKELVHMYEHSVGLNANLVLGITPDRRGLVPDADVRRMTELGEVIRHQYMPCQWKTSGQGESVLLSLPFPVEVARAIIMEDIEYGQRIRRFVLEVQTPDLSWHPLRTGESIGHKRIISFDPIQAVALRLQAPDAVATPRIRLLAALPAADSKIEPKCKNVHEQKN